MDSLFRTRWNRWKSEDAGEPFLINCKMGYGYKYGFIYVACRGTGVSRVCCLANYPPFPSIHWAWAQ